MWQRVMRFSDKKPCKYNGNIEILHDVFYFSDELCDKVHDMALQKDKNLINVFYTMYVQYIKPESYCQEVYDSLLKEYGI